MVLGVATLIKLPSLFTQSVPCHLRGDRVCVFVSYTTCNPVRRVWVFVHCAAAGKANHYVFTKAYKRHINTRELNREQ